MPRRAGARTGKKGSGTAVRFARIRGLPWRKVLLGFLIVILIVAFVPPVRRAVALGASKVILFVASPLAPDVGSFDRLPESTRVVATDGSLLAELAGEGKRTRVELQRLPEHVVHAVLAAEDKEFYEHSGVDPSAIIRAAFRNAQGDRQGGSTITQQLAKINYTGSERTFLRKLKELMYASQLERRYSKDVLLERYLNQVYFGEGAYGIAAASDSYFGKSPRDLTVAEAAMLAGKIRAPEALDPRRDLTRVRHRRDRVLENMHEEGWLDDDELEDAKAEPIELGPAKPIEAVKAPHFVELVKREAKTLDALGGTPETRITRLFTGGYTVETTLDARMFDATVASVQERLGEPGDPITATTTVVPGNGAIRNLFGGLDFQSTQFDVASLGARQPGSAFKPFVYLAALRDGIDPRTTFDGTSGRVIPCYREEPVQNYAGEDAGGHITVDEALVRSVNVVFAELGCHTGPRDVVKAGRDAGIPEDATKVQGAVFLGGLDRGVSALAMASAFATFAAEGVYAEPYSIQRILDADGDVLYEHELSMRRAFSAEEVAVLNNPLQDVVRRGTGRAAAIGRPVAGKTGTTQENRDAWFVGYVPQLSTAVWVGYEPPAPMENVHGRNVTGGSFPAQIFSDVMRAALEGVPVERLRTLSPDALDLRNLTPTTTEPTSTIPEDPSSTTEPTTTTSSTTTTTRPVRRTTTTTAPPSTTTTTDPDGDGTTTTTAPTADNDKP